MKNAILKTIMDHIEAQTIATVKKVAPAVVSIVISKMMPAVREMPMAQKFNPMDQFALPLPEMPLPGNGTEPASPSQGGHKTKIGGGSGFIVDASGTIVTNKHVVFETDAEYTVITNDEKEYQAQVLSRDPINDVAVLKIEAADLPTVTIGNSDHIELGQTAIAIGNAPGLFSQNL